MFICLYIALKNGREVLIKRARHVISETKRTQEAAEALKRRDFTKVQTHVLEYKYACTHYV